jgi:oligopeptide transport system substrate-binding protein
LRQALPFIDQAVFTREKEAIPYWNKFLQGYFDAPGISSDSFDQAVRVNVGGDVALTDEMRDKGIRLLTSVKPRRSTWASTCSIRWWAAFVALDQAAAGDFHRHRSGGVHLHFPERTRYCRARCLPPGIFGYEAGEAGHRQSGLRLG